MSYQLNIAALDSRDEFFLRAKSGDESQRKDWEDINGSIQDRPGERLEMPDDIAEETGDEYGGLLIDLSKLPKNATHIVVYRS